MDCSIGTRLIVVKLLVLPLVNVERRLYDFLFNVLVFLFFRYVFWVQNLQACCNEADF